MHTIKLLKKELANKVPLIGFSGTPWTLATYMVEGKSSQTFSKIIALKRKRPDLLYHLLEHLTLIVIDYLQAQIASGVDVVMLFDTWGSLLSASDYPIFSLNYIERILSSIHHDTGKYQLSIPSIIFTKGQLANLSAMASSGCSAISLDDRINLGEARKQVGHQVALQGNLAPNILKQTPSEIRQAVSLMLKDFGPYPGHVFNLAHGITPDVPPDHVAVMVDAVHEMTGY